MMIQQLNATINGQTYALQVQPDTYNGHAVYYLLNDDIGKMFNNSVPDHLMLMENGNGFTCSPRLTEMEGGYIVQQIWEAIRHHNNQA
jgi:hypothetical protein